MNYQDLIKTYPRYLGFGFLHSFFSSIGQTFLIALFIPSLRVTFSQSATSMGSYYGMITIMSAVTLFFTGPLIDRVNLRLYSVCVGCLVATGCATVMLAPTLFLAIVGLFLIRHGGQALLTHTASTTMSRYFTMARGKALGITGLGIAFGEAFLPLLITIAISKLGWRNTYLTLSLCCVFVFLPLSLFLVNPTDDIQHPESSQAQGSNETLEGELNWGRKQLLSQHYFWLLLPMLVMPPFLGTAYFFFQADIASAKSWSRALFASSFLAFGLTSAISSFLSGPLIDRVGAKRLLPFSLIPMMLGVWVLIVTPSILGAYLFMILIGISFGSVGNIKNAMWAEVYGRKHLGSIKSFAGMLLVFSTAISPPLGGWLLDKGYSVVSLLWGCIVLSGIASLISLMARPPKKPDVPL